MSFTKEQIDLCKEIVKYYRKPIYRGGSYIYSIWKNPELFVSVGDLPNEYQIAEAIIPLWTWKDAREWLKEKRQFLIGHHDTASGEIEIHFGKSWVSEYAGIGKTDLEAILKVVLEILKEEK
jgi:hypothetical protein